MSVPGLPFESPGYWMNESSGLLANTVSRYLAGDELGDVDLPLMRAYLRQWIEAPLFVGPEVEALRAGVDELQSTDDVRAWLERAIDAGVDPL